jgi:hypothetical protein
MRMEMLTMVVLEKRASPRAAGYPQKDGSGGSKRMLGFLHDSYSEKV